MIITYWLLEYLDSVIGTLSSYLDTNQTGDYISSALTLCICCLLLAVWRHVCAASASRLEAWLISAHQAFNRHHGLFTDVCGYTLDMAEMVKVHDQDHLTSIFRVADKMRRLNLTMEEICTFRAICILQSGNLAAVMLLNISRMLVSNRCSFCAFLVLVVSWFLQLINSYKILLLKKKN